MCAQRPAYAKPNQRNKPSNADDAERTPMAIQFRSPPRPSLNSALRFSPSKNFFQSYLQTPFVRARACACACWI